MRQAKKIKLHKLSVLILGIMVLANFSFCLAPFASAAQVQSRQIEEATSGINQNDRMLNMQESCEKPTTATGTVQTKVEETKTEPNDNTKNDNNVLPCCLDHDRITKIDTATNFKIKNLTLSAIVNDAVLNDTPKIQNSSYVNTLDLPPPEPDILSSVFKKE